MMESKSINYGHKILRSTFMYNYVTKPSFEYINYTVSYDIHSYLCLLSNL